MLKRYLPSLVLLFSVTFSFAQIPAGFYTAADGLTCQPLKTKLKEISETGYNQLSYTPGVWNAYQYTDIHRNNANTANVIWDVYSAKATGPEPYTYTFATDQCGSYTGEGNCYNREHSTPKSWFNDSYPMYSDIQHLYPTDGYVNNKRDNFPYGEVTSATYTSQNGSKLGTGTTNYGYSGTVFEPINEFKGDLARTSFYMATRYEDEIISQNWAANGTANALFLSAADQPDAAKRKLQIYDNWYLKTIYKWSVNDPVSQKEIDRNNAIYYQSGQHNRNPYVDHPEYIAMVYQCTAILPVTVIDFTAQKTNATVILKWTATYETSFKLFEIQRSTNGIDYNKIGDVEGRNLTNYSFIDGNLPNAPVVYYRLKMIDADNKFSNSRVASARLNNDLSNAVVYPNPTLGKLNIRLDQALNAASTLQVTDFAGRQVRKQLIADGSVVISIDVEDLPAGRYFIKISNPQQVINQSFVIIR